MSSGSDDLTGISCEWCKEPAALKLSIRKKIPKVGFMDSGMFLFCCRAHEEIAKEVAKNYG